MHLSPAAFPPLPPEEPKANKGISAVDWSSFFSVPQLNVELKVNNNQMIGMVLNFKFNALLVYNLLTHIYW